MDLKKYHRNSFVCELPCKSQQTILKECRKALQKQGMTDKEIERELELIMNSRVYNIENLINITYILKSADLKRWKEREGKEI